MRETPRAADGKDRHDAARISYVREYWAAQDDALRPRDRAIEQQVRFLAGQQWLEWSPLMREWVDVSAYQTDEERRRDLWPVVNLLLPWFLLTHTRFTESPVVLTFEAGPDEVDAQLADVLDTIFKTLWRETGMAGRWDEAAAWVVAAGRAYLQTRIDPTGGPMRPWIGRAQLPMTTPEGGQLVGPDGQPILHDVDDVPFDKDGQPLMRLTPDGPITLGEPHAEPEGCLAIDVLSPLEVRAEWGPAPWHEKGCHLTRTFHTPDEVYRRWGVEAQPTIRGEAVTGGDGNMPYLRRMLFSAGHFGAAGDGPRTSLFDGAHSGGQEWVEVTTKWQRRASEGDHGRLTVVTPDQLLFDGPAPASFKYTSPIRAFGFVRIPGRVHETTPLEMMLPIQRSINLGDKQILEHRALVTNPIFLVDKGSGLGNQELVMAPGDGYEVNRTPGIPPIEWVAPPALPADVWRIREQLVSTLMELGSLKGTEGAPPTDDASGELVKELRFNSDRPLAPPLRRAAEEFARMAEDWRALLPIIWDREKTISYAGEDNLARVITVEPHLWEEGSVNVIADTESMLPEGRGERQARVYRMWKDGMFGVPPQSPQALKTYFDLARFPHLGRATRPGGPDRVMAERTLGLLLSGAPAARVPWFPWYDELTHMDVLATYMKGPEFLKQPQPIQRELAVRWETLLAMAKQKAASAAAHAFAPGAAPNGGSTGAPGAPNDGSRSDSPPNRPAPAPAGPGPR